MATHGNPGWWHRFGQGKKRDEKQDFAKKEELDQFLRFVIANCRKLTDGSISHQSFVDEVITRAGTLKDPKLFMFVRNWLTSGSAESGLPSVPSELFGFLKSRQICFHCAMPPNFSYILGEIGARVNVRGIEIAELTSCEGWVLNCDRQAFLITVAKGESVSHNIFLLPPKESVEVKEFEDIVNGRLPFGLIFGKNVECIINKVVSLNNSNAEEFEHILNENRSELQCAALLVIAIWYAKNMLEHDNLLSENANNLKDKLRISDVYVNIHYAELAKVFSAMVKKDPELLKRYANHREWHSYIETLVETAFGPMPLYALYRGYVGLFVAHLNSINASQIRVADEPPKGIIATDYKRNLDPRTIAYANLVEIFEQSMDRNRIVASEEELRAFATEELNRIFIHLTGSRYDDIFETGEIGREYLDRK